MVVEALIQKIMYLSTLITRVARVQRHFERANIVVVVEGIISQMARVIVNPNEGTLAYKRF